MTQNQKNKPQPLWEGLLLLLIRIALIAFFFKVFGLFFCFPLYFFLIFIYHKIIYFLFGLKALSGYDKLFITTNPLGRYQIVSMTRYKNLQPEKFKEFLIEKMINKLNKLRCYIVKKNLEYFWYEDPNLEKVYNRIIIVPKLKDFEQVLEYIQKEINNKSDIFNDYPYQMFIIPYGNENEGVCLFKYDHLLSDGLGLIESLILISDSYNEEYFPKLMRNIREPNFLENIYLYLVSPFFAIFLFIYFFLYKGRESPYKANKKICSNNSKFVLSKQFKLKDFEKFRKEKKVSFNDIMLSAFSLAVNNQIKNYEKFIGQKNLVIDLPVGRKRPPNTLDLVEIDNQASGVLCDIPIIGDIDQCKQVTKHIRKFFRPEFLISVALISDALGNLLPWHIVSKNAILFNERFDFLFTNVPGPAKKLSYYGMEVEEMMSFTSAGGGLPFVVIVSYNGNFRILISSNENADCDIKKLLTEYEDTLNKFII